MRCLPERCADYIETARRGSPHFSVAPEWRRWQAVIWRPLFHVPSPARLRGERGRLFPVSK